MCSRTCADGKCFSLGESRKAIMRHGADVVFVIPVFAPERLVVQHRVHELRVMLPSTSRLEAMIWIAHGHQGERVQTVK